MTKLQMIERIKELNKKSIEVLGWSKYTKIFSAFAKELGIKEMYVAKSWKKERIEKHLTLALIVADCCE